MSTRSCVFALFALLFSAVPFAQQEAKALGFGCAGVAGEVVFLDTLYGTATGLVGGGIVEVLQDNHSDWTKRVATGAAIGAGLGLVLGGLEVGLRDCSDPSRVRHTSVQPGWQAPRFIFVPGTLGNLNSSVAGMQITFLKN